MYLNYSSLKECVWFPHATCCLLEILDEMSSIRYIEHKGRANRITPFVCDQLIIADTFGYEIPKGCEPDYKSKKVPHKRGRPRKNT